MKKISYPQFVQKLHKAGQKNNRPLRVMFELTYRCNFRCAHCYVPLSFQKQYRHKELTTEEIRHILIQLKKAGCFYLGFTGGEPLMRPDILDILAFSKQCGFITALYTNGSLVDKEMAKALGCLGITRVDMTLPATSEAVYRVVTKARGVRKRVFEAMRFLKENKITLSLKSCVLASNQQEVEEIHDLAQRRRIFLRLDDMLFPRWDADRAPFRLRRKLPSSQRMATQGKCGGISLPAPKTKEVFSCGAGLTQAAITPSGELKFCLMINYPKYDILKTGFDKAWRRLNTLASSVKIDAEFLCDTCRYQPVCGWCPAYSWIMTKTFTSCPGLHELYQA